MLDPQSDISAADFADVPPMIGFSPWSLLDPMMWLYSPLSLLGTAFWVWMLIHCIRKDTERTTWLWLLVLVFVPFIGAAVYFVIRVLPAYHLTTPTFFRRFTSGRQMARLEHAARNIGNAHQWHELAELQREIGRTEDAVHSYQKALQKDPTYLPALWGAAQTALLRKNPAEARPHLQTILQKDFSYKFGDVSLAYGRTLFDLHESAAARTHLEFHLKRWTHPEAHVLLAKLLAEAGEPARARVHLEQMLADFSAAPPFFTRQHRRWASQARSLLKTLPS